MADQLLDETSKFVSLMITNAQQACIREVGVVSTMITAKQLAEAVYAVLPGFPVTLDDNYYAIADIGAWNKIIALDWTSRKKYIADIWDCDNFSDSFRSHVSEIYNLNSAGAFHCVVTNNLQTINKVGHRAVLIVAYDENKVLSVYAYESENEGIVKIEKGQQISIPVFGTIWNYAPVDGEFN